jgi:hypothetical protein
MKELKAVYGDRVVGSMSGWDRLRFRGTIRWLANMHGIASYMSTRNILLKEFGAWAGRITASVREACARQAERLGIPMIYLRSSTVDKEALARHIAQDRAVDTGDICMFSVVEPCLAPLVRGNRATKEIELQMGLRKCVWIYHYWNDPVVGFGHSRLQTWLPLNATICINGRHWLERQLIREGIGYIKDGNCFPWVADLARAQAKLDEQLKTDWPTLLQGLLDRNCPSVRTLFGEDYMNYYWSADESEWATDILFRSTKELDATFPSLVRYGLVSAQSPAVMRFLGRQMSEGKRRGRAPNEVTTDLRKRYEGVRLKHWINQNSIKMYNKAGSVLRIETTINSTREFKVFRHPDDDRSRPASWQKMRKGVSDMHRRAQISEGCNKRYAEHLAAASLKETLYQCAREICKPVVKDGHRYRAINPWRKDDFDTLQFLARGEFSISGFRNADLLRTLCPGDKPRNPQERKQWSARVSRRIRLLRAHGLVKKIAHSNRYSLTTKGRKLVTAILAASSADTEQLMNIAA